MQKSQRKKTPDGDGDYSQDFYSIWLFIYEIWILADIR